LETIPPSVYVKKVRADDVKRAGIQKGDLILGIGEQEFHQSEIKNTPTTVLLSAIFKLLHQDLKPDRTVAKFRAGETVDFLVMRDQERKSITVTLPLRVFASSFGIPYALSIFSLFCLFWMFRGTFLSLRHYSGDDSNPEKEKRTMAWEAILYTGFWGLIIISTFVVDYSTSLFISDILAWGFFVLAFIMPRRVKDNPLRSGIVAILSPIVEYLSATKDKDTEDDEKEKHGPKPPQPTPLFQESLRPQKTDFLVPAILATVVFAVLFLLHTYLPSFPGDKASFFTPEGLRVKLFPPNESIPSYAILWTFLFGLFYLLAIWRKKYEYLSPTNPKNSAIWRAANTRNFKALVNVLNQQSSAGTISYYGSRFQQLVKRYNKDPDLNAVLAMRDDILEADENDFALSFVMVTWVEVALPILGFLGTVVGLGISISGMQEGVSKLSLEGGTLRDILDNLTQGFEGLGVAFTTTFLGLAGVFILSLFQTLLKKHIAVRLAEARNIFSNVISQWVTNSVVGRLNAGVFELAHVNSAWEHIIFEHPGHQYDAIRKILFKPLIIFQKIGEDVNRERNKFIQQKLGEGWKFDCMGIPTSNFHGGVVSVKKESNNYLYRFQIHNSVTDHIIQTNTGFQQLFLSSDLRTIFGLNDRRQLVLGNWSEDGEGDIQMVPVDNQPLKEKEKVSQVRMYGKDVVLIGRDNGRNISVYSIDLTPGAKPEPWSQLSEIFSWNPDLWAVHVASGTLFAAGKSTQGNNWHIQRIQPENPNNQEVSDFSPGLVPSQLIPLAKDKLLILDAKGKLFYWDITGHPPYLLSVPRGDWDVDSTSAIRVGADGWIAVIANSLLRMWQLRKQSVLVPYEPREDERDRFPTSNITSDKFLTTSDGEYLLAIFSGQNIATWKFPKTVADKR